MCLNCLIRQIPSLDDIVFLRINVTENNFSHMEITYDYLVGQLYMTINFTNNNLYKYIMAQG